MFSNKTIIITILFIMTLNLSAMKRQRDESHECITEPHKKRKTNNSEITNHSVALGLAHNKKSKLNTKQFPRIINSEKNAPILHNNYYAITPFISPTEDQKKKLYNAIENNNFAEVESYLKMKIDPNIILEDGFSPLSQTTQSICNCLAKNNCNCLCQEQAIKIATSLILNGAELNLTDNNYQPLHYAASEGKSQLAQLFINYGAQINHQDNPTKSTPLHLAIDKGDSATIKCLIGNGANKGIKDIYQNTGEEILLHHHWISDKQKDMILSNLNNQRNIFFKKHGNPLLIGEKQKIGINKKKLLIKESF